MAITEYDKIDGVTIGTTEISIVSGTSTLQTLTDKGLFQLWLDPVGASMAKADRFIARVYEKVKAAGTKRVVFSCSLYNAQAENIVLPSLVLLNGWDMTLQKLAGTDRAWDASIRQLVSSTPITEYHAMSAVTVGSTEVSITHDDTSLQTKTDAGAYQLFIDPVTNMAKNDQFLVQIYEKVEGSGGTKRVAFSDTLDGTQAELFVTPMLALLNGWEMTIKKTAGTDRAFDASIRRIN